MFSTNGTCEDLKECYLVSNIPKRNLTSGCHLLKKLINRHGGQLDVTKNIYLKSCAYHPNSECCTFFHRNLSDPKSSEGTLLYLSLETCWSRLIYTKISSYRSFVINMYIITWRDAVFLHEVSIGRSKEDEKLIFFTYVSRFPLSEVKTTQKKKKKKKRKTSIERS